MEHPVIHSMKRRCFCHDYYERGIYMITLEVEGRRPILGSLAGGKIVRSPLGAAVAACWRRLTRAQCLALNRLAADICGPGAAALNYAGLVPLEEPHSAAPASFTTAP